jgi:hypothetical protein
MSAFFGVLFKPQPPPTLAVDLVNADADGTVAATIADGLQRDAIVVRRADAVTPGRIALVVPAGTAAAMAAGTPVDLALHTGKEETRSEADLRLKVMKIMIASALGMKLLAFLTLFALACASLGIFFGTLFRDPDKCRAAAIWTAILLAPLGGLWWPIEIVGPTLKRVSHLVPTGWAMEPINAMLAFGAGAREVLPFAAAFLALFAVTFVAAARRLDPA